MQLGLFGRLPRPSHPSHPSHHRSHRIIASIAPICALVVLALVIYTPWTPVPFPLIDYSEFLHLFRESGSFVAGLGRVVDYYHSHGRSSYLAYVQLAANWLFFGDWPVGWNVAVFVYSAAALVSVWLLLVRLGNRLPAATLAAALLIVATPAVPVWLRPTGEPLALLFLSLALIVALSYQQAVHWRRRLAVLLVLLLGLALAKDLLAPLVLFPAFVACCWQDGFRRPRLDTRTVWLLAGVGTVLFVSLLLIMHALSLRVPDAYTRGYHPGNVSLPAFIGQFWITLLPHTRGFEAQQFNPGHLLANLSFVLVLAAGWWIALRERRGLASQELNGWLALVLFGVLLYLPLGWFSPLYALPFFLGSIALFARALSVLEQKRPFVRGLGRAGALFVLIVCGVTAFNAAREETATRRLHGRLSETLRGLQPVDSLLVQWPEVNRWEWAQRGVVIRRYAIDRGDLPADAPPARDVRCGSVRPDRIRGRVLVLNYPGVCDELPFDAGELTQAYLALDPLPVKRSVRLEMAVVGIAGGGSPPQ